MKEEASDRTVDTDDITSEELEKLKTQVAQLERENTQLQAASSRRTSSISHSHTPPSDLADELKTKSATIESMELEISNLGAQLQRVTSGTAAEREQIAALEEKLARTQKSLDNSAQELGDLKKNLERTTEKAVKEGSSRTSAETKARALEQEAEGLRTENEEIGRKVETLGKKILALTNLHKEVEVRSQGYKKEKEVAEEEAKELKSKLAGLENDHLRLKEELERKRKSNVDGDDDGGVDELEMEVRQELERKVRALESEIFDMKRGHWRDGRKEMDPGMDAFQDVPLSTPGDRKRTMSHTKGGWAGFIKAGIDTVTGAGDEDALLEDDGDDFDEEAFRKAHEAEGMREIERVRGIKRGLDKWKGYRVDLVDMRRSVGEGYGEIFEV